MPTDFPPTDPGPPDGEPPYDVDLPFWPTALICFVAFVLTVLVARC